MARLYALNNQFSRSLSYFKNLVQYDLVKGNEDDFTTIVGTVIDQSFQQGKYSLSQELLDLILQITPNLPEAWYFKGECAFYMKKYQNAIQYYKTFLEKAPPSSEANNRIGVAYVHSDSIDVSIPYFQNAIKIDSTYMYSYFNLADVYTIQEKPIDAVKEYLLAFSFTPETSKKESIINHYLTNLLKGSYDATTKIQMYHLIIDKIPENGGLYSGLGYELVQVKNWEEAESKFQRAIQLGELSAWNYNYLGLTQLKQNRTEKAIESYNKSLKINPDNKWSSWRLGLIYQSQDNCLKAIKYYKEAIRPDSTYLRAWKGKAECELQIGYFEAAIVSLHKTIQLSKNDSIDYLTDLAMSFHGAGKLKEEKQAYQKNYYLHKKIVENNPNNANNWGNLSWHALFAGKFVEAIEATDKGIQLNPEELFIYKNKICSLLFLDKIPESKELFNKYKDRQIDGIAFKDIITKDLDELSNTYIINLPNVEKNIKKMKKHIKQSSNIIKLSH